MNDPHVILSIVTLALTALAVLAFFFYRSVQADQQRRVTVLEVGREDDRKAREALAERLRLDELETARMRGDLDLAKHRLGELERDQMPRDEIRGLVEGMRNLMTSQFDALGKRIDGLDRNRGRYTSSDPAFPAQRKANP